VVLKYNQEIRKPRPETINTIISRIKNKKKEREEDRKKANAL